MSSSRHRLQWSPNLLHHRAFNRPTHIGPFPTNTIPLNLSPREPRSSTSFAQVTNQSQQPNIHPHISRTSTLLTTTWSNRQEDESSAADQLIQQLKEVIRAFMIRPGRRFDYRANITWTIDYSNQINYHAVISINSSSQLL